MTEAPLAAPRRAKRWLTVREMCVFSMLGALMFVSKLLMEWAPNVHFVDLFIITFTVVYRKKALIPLYLFVLLTGLFNGFTPWLLPYFYVWLFPFLLVMLLPRRMPPALAVPLYMAVGGLHGILFGVLYAPAQAWLFGLDFDGMLTWIAAGLPFDVIHAIGNIASCSLVLPLSRVLLRLERAVRSRS